MFDSQWKKYLRQISAFLIIWTTISDCPTPLKHVWTVQYIYMYDNEASEHCWIIIHIPRAITEECIPHDCILYTYTAVRTNNDVEGWYHRIDRRNQTSCLPFYLLVILQRMDTANISNQFEIISKVLLRRDISGSPPGYGPTLRQLPWDVIRVYKLVKTCGQIDSVQWWAWIEYMYIATENFIDKMFFK